LQIPWVDGSSVSTEVFMLEGTLEHIGHLGWIETRDIYIMGQILGEMEGLRKDI